MLQLFHEELGHQRIEHTSALVREHFIWSTVHQDVTSWVKRCKKAKGPYNDPNVKLGLLIANGPLDLLCLDFTKMDHIKDGKENVLAMMNPFSNFTVAVVTANEQAKTVSKALVDKWLYTYGIPSRIHYDLDKAFDNQIMRHLCTMYGIKQSRTTPYNPGSNPKCERFNQILYHLLKGVPQLTKT